jgi:hypothetical protein
MIIPKHWAESRQWPIGRILACRRPGKAGGTQ